MSTVGNPSNFDPIKINPLIPPNVETSQPTSQKQISDTSTRQPSLDPLAAIQKEANDQLQLASATVDMQSNQSVKKTSVNIVKKLTNVTGEAAKLGGKIAPKDSNLQNVLSTVGKGLNVASRVLGDLVTLQSLGEAFSATKEGKEINDKIAMLHNKLNDLKTDPESGEASKKIQNKIEALEYKKEKIILKTYTNAAKNIAISTNHALNVAERTTSFVGAAAPALGTAVQVTGGIASVLGGAVQATNLYTDVNERELIEKQGLEDMNAAIPNLENPEVKELAEMRKKTFEALYDSNIVNTVKNSQLLSGSSVSIATGIAVAAGATGVGVVVGAAVGATLGIGLGLAYLGKTVYDNRHTITHSAESIKTKAEQTIADANLFIANYKMSNLTEEQAKATSMFINEEIKEALQDCNEKLDPLVDKIAYYDEALETTKEAIREFTGRGNEKVEAFNHVNERLQTQGGKTENINGLSRRLFHVEKDKETYLTKSQEAMQKNDLPELVKNSNYLIAANLIEKMTNHKLSQLKTLRDINDIKELKEELIETSVSMSTEAKDIMKSSYNVESNLRQTIVDIEKEHAEITERVNNLNEIGELTDLAFYHQMKPNEMYELLTAKIKDLEGNSHLDAEMKKECERVGIDPGDYESNRFKAMISYLMPKY